MLKKLIVCMLVLCLFTGVVFALSEGQINTIKTTISQLDAKINIIIAAREDVKALLRIEGFVVDDVLVLEQIRKAKQRAATAASELNDLLQ